MGINFKYDCWEGQLPLVEKVPEDDVVFCHIRYSKSHISLAGLDFYFAYQTDDGFEAGGWVDPSQPWANAEWVGRKYIFDKGGNKIRFENLTEVPTVKSFHAGIMMPDDQAREIGLIK